MEDVLTEERRLFYVAVTRAERRLLLLTEHESESLYLRQLRPEAESDDTDWLDEPAEQSEAQKSQWAKWRST